MYWIFLAIFIITVLVPDIIGSGYLNLSETRTEEVLIFLLGGLAFAIFIKNERVILFQKKEKEKDEKRIEQTVKDLVESYSYIGEVNRKMDILMNIALGLADRKALDKNQEKETYSSIASATAHLLKADYCILKFINQSDGKTVQEYRMQGKRMAVKNEDLLEMGEKVNIKKTQECLIVSSTQTIKKTKSYLLICGYDKEEENSPKNMEILKVFASQALFVYSYAHSREIS